MKTDILITGDFNIDWSKNSFYENKIEKIIKENGFMQIVEKYTRITETSSTIIDYVITNSPNVKILDKSDIISDHEIIKLEVQHTECYHKTAIIFLILILLKYLYMIRTLFQRNCAIM